MAIYQNLNKPRENQPQPAGSAGSKAENTAYLRISLSKLAFLSIITFGIYEYYWFYKNWAAVKKAEQSDISPFWRAVFAVVLSHSLFKKMLTSAKSKNYERSFSPILLALFYFIIMFISNSSVTIPEDITSFAGLDLFTLNIIWLIIALSSFIPLAIAQSSMVKNTTST